MEIYQSKWVATNGSRASELWYALISKSGERGCLRILERCRDDIRHGREWPPTVVEAELMLNTRSKSEAQQAFMRWEVGEPQGRAEKWVNQKYSWNLKRAAAGKEFFEYEKHLRLADELERHGKLQLAEEELAMLPVNSTVHITDIEREEYARSGKTHAFTDRINALRRMKRD